MPNYNSKSYKKSKNSKNSKSGGRRRKHTMRKYRRGKKVMRGGADTVTYDQLKTQLEKDNAMADFLKTVAKGSFDEFKRVGEGADTVDIRNIYNTFFKDTGTKVEISLLTLLAK